MKKRFFYIHLPASFKLRAFKVIKRFPKKTFSTEGRFNIDKRTRNKAMITYSIYEKETQIVSIR